MQEDTYKKIRKSFRFETSGEEIYVEIGTKNVPPRIKTETVIDFLKTLFEETIDQLEAPVMPDTGSKAEDPHRSSAGDIKEADMLRQEEFEKLMQGWIQEHHRATFTTEAAPDKEQAKGSGQDGGLASTLQGIKDILERIENASSATTFGPGMMIDITPAYTSGATREDIQTLCRLSRKVFDLMMRDHEKDKVRKSGRYISGGGAPGPHISIPCPPKKELDR